jgi:hypothetical protein
MTHGSGTVAPARLLICFFSWKQPYGPPHIPDKIHAKSLKTGKKEISTHVFGNFDRTTANRKNGSANDLSPTDEYNSAIAEQLSRNLRIPPFSKGGIDALNTFSTRPAVAFHPLEHFPECGTDTPVCSFGQIRLRHPVSARHARVSAPHKRLRFLRFNPVPGQLKVCT